MAIFTLFIKLIEISRKVYNIYRYNVKTGLRNKGETSQIQNTSFACEDMARFSTIILQIKPAVVSFPYSKFNRRPTFSTTNTATLMAVTNENITMGFLF